VQHDQQPQESQDCQLVEKKVRNHGKPPSLGGETGGFDLILGPMEFSAAERYTTAFLLCLACSSRRIAREVGVHVRTSYRWCWRLRNAALSYEMDRQLAGTVEADDLYPTAGNKGQAKGGGKKSSLNSSLFVARKHWLKSRDSPPCFSANLAKREELHRGLRGPMYTNCDQLQTLIN
jgi:hypothetical protein